MVNTRLTAAKLAEVQAKKLLLTMRAPVLIKE